MHRNIISFIGSSTTIYDLFNPPPIPTIRYILNNFFFPVIILGGKISALIGKYYYELNVFAELFLLKRLDSNIVYIDSIVTGVGGI